MLIPLAVSAQGVIPGFGLTEDFTEWTVLTAQVPPPPHCMFQSVLTLSRNRATGQEDG